MTSEELDIVDIDRAAVERPGRKLTRSVAVRALRQEGNGRHRSEDVVRARARFGVGPARDPGFGKRHTEFGDLGRDGDVPPQLDPLLRTGVVRTFQIDAERSRDVRADLEADESRV